MLPDFRDYRGKYVLAHSAKGSEWGKHKYVKKIDGVYYYPAGYDKGRTVKSLGTKSKGLSDKQKEAFEEFKNKQSSNSKSGKNELTPEEKKKKRKRINRLAKKVIRGEYGVGEDRQQKLGKKYNRVQHRVNQMLLGKEAAARIKARRTQASTGTGTTTDKKKSTKKKLSSKK